MHRLALSLLLVAATACTEPVTGTATVSIRSGLDIPLANWPVAFHGSDGRLLAASATDELGSVQGPMEPDGMVTYRGAVDWPLLVTRGNVQPGEHVLNGPPHAPPEPTWNFVVSTTATPAGARLCRVVVPCRARAIEGRGVPGRDITLALPDSCSAAYVLVTATDDRGETIAYAHLAATTPRVLVDQWRTDFTMVPIEVAAGGADEYRYTGGLTSYIGDAPVAWAPIDGDAAATDVSVTAMLPVETGMTALDFDAFYPTNEIQMTLTQPTGTAFRLRAADLPPRMTSASLEQGGTRPTVRWHTERELDPDAVVNAVLYEPRGGAWLVENMRGTSVQVPEIPASMSIAAPSELSLVSVGATVQAAIDHGVAVTATTAMPRVPDLSEFPFGLD